MKGRKTEIRKEITKLLPCLKDINDIVTWGEKNKKTTRKSGGKLFKLILEHSSQRQDQFPQISNIRLHQYKQITLHWKT